MYDRDRADIYDLVYQDRKDYGAEAALVARLVRERLPGATSLLDVACGTGTHLRTFAALFDRVEGIDLAEPMIAVAARRLSGVPIHRGDMRDFRLGRTFDAVACLFSSVGYLGSVDDLEAALGSMASHVTPGGVLVVEPWYFPESFLDGYVSGHASTQDGRTVARVSHSTRSGGATRMEIHFLVADASGVRYRTEVDMLQLFTRDQYEAAFVRAGCKPEYVDADGTGPGFFVGVRS